MISVQNLHMINNQYMYFVCTFLWWIILIIHAPTINVHALFQLNVSAFEALHDVFIVCDIKKTHKLSVFDLRGLHISDSHDISIWVN